MENEIAVRKPKPLSLFMNRSYKYKWMQSLPKEGERIRLTWLPDNRGAANAYIGFEGVVEDVNRTEGTFILNSGSSVLVCHDNNFNYVRL